jgi:dihydropteroate synthase type 2
MTLFKRPQIVGIINITVDSFSDGGRYLEPAAAIAHAQDLLTGGADILELGAASSNPDAAKVPGDVEISRLEPVLAALRPAHVPIAVDTTQPQVQRWVLAAGVAILNDIRGFPDTAVDADLARSGAKLVVMHSISGSDRAVRKQMSARAVFDSINRFFEHRLSRLIQSGIARSRLIIDPGMGFFLASNPEPSLAVLANLTKLREAFRLPVMISVSRKSFLRSLATPQDCDINSRTLAAEIFACTQCVDYIRTHDVRALRQALLTLEAIESASDTELP